MQDGDHIDGHYITMFAEQLTRTFEVLVKSVKLVFITMALRTWIIKSKHQNTETMES